MVLTTSGPRPHLRQSRLRRASLRRGVWKGSSTTMPTSARSSVNSNWIIPSARVRYRTARGSIRLSAKTDTLRWCSLTGPYLLPRGLPTTPFAECVVVTAVRDGMNLTPYEYIVCRRGIHGVNSGSKEEGTKKKNMLVVLEFIGCSPSLSGAIQTFAPSARAFCMTWRGHAEITLRGDAGELCLGFGFRMVALDQLLI